MTGETKLEDIPGSQVKPDVVYDSIKEMGEMLRKRF